MLRTSSPVDNSNYTDDLFPRTRAPWSLQDMIEWDRGLSLTGAGYKQLEAAGRDFLWGQSAGGKNRKPLIAWSSITKPYKEGGLQIRPFLQVAEALKIKYMGRLLNGEDENWASMLKFFIRKIMRKSAHGQETRWWTLEEGLLLLNSITLKDFPTANHFIKSWMKVRKRLTMRADEWELPQGFTFKQAEQMLKLYWSGEKPNLRIVLPLIKKLNMSTLLHAQKHTGTWKDIQEELIDKGINLSQAQEIEVGILQRWLNTVRLAPIKLQESSSWRWHSSPGEWRGWEKPSRFWYKLLQPEERPEDLTGRWPPAPSILTWADRWRLLWQKGNSNRTILWIWRVLRKGFFTGSRAVAMRVSNELCCRCSLESKTIVHMFWGCKEVRSMWTHLRRIAFESDSSFRIKETLMATLDEALTTIKSGEVLTTILAAVFQAIWSDRNKRHFRNQRGKTPVEIILKQSRLEVEASFRLTDSKSRWEKKLETLNEVNKLITRAGEYRNRGGSTHSGIGGLVLTLTTTEVEHRVTDTSEAAERDDNEVLDDQLSALTLDETTRLTDTSGGALQIGQE
ncbi:hypothetical protein R1sor_022108 [Riccia sorocarpa]|uniref:Reverse transcriptase zinc-binding domain-containing protein n=1 Tax=Riccia sorocarpa TaxID=122646 RepID=A0ABD3GKV5_9MARC